MLRFVAAAFVLFAASAAFADDACFGSDADALATALEKAGSCRAAFAKFSACAWGSSADLAFGDIVIKTCEGEFLAKLSPAGKANYDDESTLCEYQYEREEGTMYRSLASLCRAGVAARFADQPALADHPLPRASFDCAKARTPLETAICADPKLGRADLMLSRIYGQATQSLTPDEKRAVAVDERRWIARLAGDCHLDPVAGAKARDCARAAFEARFTALADCEGAPDIAKCLASPE